MQTFHDADASPEFLRDRTVAILGYGSQGHAHALDLRDSGMRSKISDTAEFGDLTRGAHDERERGW